MWLDRELLFIHIPPVGPYSTQHLLAFQSDLQPNQAMVCQQPQDSDQIPNIVPIINSTEEFFSAGRWKVYDHNPHMDAACQDFTVEPAGAG